MQTYVYPEDVDYLVKIHSINGERYMLERTGSTLLGVHGM